MKKLARIFLRLLLPLPLVLAVNRFLRGLAAQGHRLQYFLQWRIAQRCPAWFDHNIDHYWKWRASRNPGIWQRGILGLFAMRPGCRVLELCCGDGFYSYYFYSGKASKIVAMDHDADAIRHARHNQNAPNIEYRCGDIRTQMPQGEFDNVCWDAGIEYFTVAETEAVLADIGRRLAPGGILSGCGIVGRPEGRSHPDHKHEFSSPHELASFLRRFFANVLVISTQEADRFQARSSLHFFASSGALPFDLNGKEMVRLGPLQP
jgi:SAM-dependent methyltransferase